MFWQAFYPAIIAAVLALAGNAVLLQLQTKVKIAEERRNFVREKHDETVDVVADMTLFLRELRRYVIVPPTAEDLQKTESIITERWEGDLLRRLGRLRFGHPDPDVRQAAEQVDTDSWPYITAAAYREDAGADAGFPSPMFSPEKRKEISRAMDSTMKEFRRAVYAAPVRKLPKNPGYDGEDSPAKFRNKLTSEQNDDESK
ncbi:hypothetical protein FHX42_001152 [Saccharopolyspora lacisalsi]|uniref:Uncharacterized protein n=1 Tax=Halosaccharopolyspora lacisalsi TaxID=1000566 RepID=A0A839DRX1_9PSEU|nr:hypothetical protein [Halosaccharopolyspora lacisalsi]MBA8823823.1 hypothetical protein [Halosaccharopolyspora lacisalsi]